MFKKIPVVPHSALWVFFSHIPCLSVLFSLARCFFLNLKSSVQISVTLSENGGGTKGVSFSWVLSFDSATQSHGILPSLQRSHAHSQHTCARPSARRNRKWLLPGLHKEVTALCSQKHTWKFPFH